MKTKMTIKELKNDFVTVIDTGLNLNYLFSIFSENAFISNKYGWVCDVLDAFNLTIEHRNTAITCGYSPNVKKSIIPSHELLHKYNDIFKMIYDKMTKCNYEDAFNIKLGAMKALQNFIDETIREEIENDC